MERNDDLRVLADELQALGTPMALAGSELALAMICRFAGDPHAALAHDRRALDLYTQCGNLRGAASAHLNIGIEFSELGNPTQAVEAYHQALTVFEELNDVPGIGHTLVNLGISVSTEGHPDKALEYYHRALDLFQQNDCKPDAAKVTGNIGVIYYSYGDLPKALEYYRRAEALYRELDMLGGLSSTIGNIGSLLHDLKEYHNAIEHFQQALELAQQAGERVTIAQMVGSMGMSFASLGEFERSLECTNRALDEYRAMGQAGNVVMCLVHQMSTLIEMQRWEDAESTLQEVQELLPVRPNVQMQYLAHCATLFEHRGDLQGASDLLIKGLEVAESVGRRQYVAYLHLRLRDLARAMNDFEGYVRHNDANQKINEDVRGTDATKRFHLIETEHRLAAERAERERERAVLFSALPRSVAERVIRGENVSGDVYENAAVLFVDIVGFTNSSATLHPQVVSKLLGDIFQRFDEICANHNVVKVKTIGDAYMAVSLEHGEQNVLHLSAAALDMNRIEFTWPTINSLVRFRMGLHCGSVVAGVLGQDRLQYDVWGDTVNIASRMESTSEPGRIHISEALAKALNESLEKSLNEALTKAHIVPRGEIEVKGKGLMKTYWLG